MVKQNDDQAANWDLEEWKRALTINVGTAYVCKSCNNVVMVTRGGVGVMELVCCGVLMERADPAGAGGGR